MINVVGLVVGKQPVDRKQFPANLRKKIKTNRKEYSLQLVHNGKKYELTMGLIPACQKDEVFNKCAMTLTEVAEFAQPTHMPREAMVLEGLDIQVLDFDDKPYLMKPYHHSSSGLGGDWIDCHNLGYVYVCNIACDIFHIERKMVGQCFENYELRFNLDYFKEV